MTNDEYHGCGIRPVSNSSLEDVELLLEISGLSMRVRLSAV
jgi:hypothetical protein